MSTNSQNQRQLIFENNFSEITSWALNPYHNGLTHRVTRSETQTVAQIRESANKSEKIWGNSMIGQTFNNNWTTLLGEGIVHDTLCKRGEHPRKPDCRGGYQPDWETDNCIYEVKTRNWTTSGTAGEKVLGVPFKYSDVPLLYSKPLCIVCVAYQEWELTNGKTKVFGEVSERKRRFLDLAESMGITYVKFSDLANY